MSDVSYPYEQRHALHASYLRRRWRPRWLKACGAVQLDRQGRHVSSRSLSQSIGNGGRNPPVRALYPHVRSRSEFQQVGVYLLLGPRENGDGDKVYIGEGDPVRPRFEDHYAKKDFW